MDATELVAEPAGPDTDEEIVRRVLDGDAASFERILRRYNQRLYRVARSIVGDDGEAEDVVQEAYLRAYEHLGGFAGRSSFATWLTRIAVHEASARRRRRQRVRFVDMRDVKSLTMGTASDFRDADDRAGISELRDVLRVGESATDIRFFRREDGRSDYEVLDRRGTLHVLRQPSPWSLTANLGERMKDALLSLLPGR